MSPGPNDLLPCATDGARRRHAAHGETCLTCEPDAEWMTCCPSCWRSAPIAGRVVQEHTIGGRGSLGVQRPCPGEGRLVDPPVVAGRPIWVPGEPRMAIVQALRSLRIPEGAA
jgi:hypothetical protein